MITIILNWNGKHHLATCLDSLLETTYRNHRFLLVDNGSADGSVEFVKKNYPSVELLVNEENLGFAKGNNVGFRYALEAGADYVVLLNADTEVEPDWLTELVRVAIDDPRAGICGSKIIMYAHRELISSFGHKMNLLGFAWDACVGRVNTDRWDDVIEVVSVCGAALLIRREALEKTGLFDPMYFAYYEDVDLAMRVRMSGYTVKVVPRSIVYHKYSAFFEQQPLAKSFLSKRNYFLFVLKFFPLRKIPWVFNRIMSNEIALFKENLRSGDFAFCRIRVRSFAAAMARLPRIILSRMRLPGKMPDSFWNLLQQRIDVPVNFGQKLDYEPNARPETGRYPHRVMMGVSDRYLGMGWYPMSSGESGRFRWIGRSASCRLSPSRPGEQMLQLHVNCPYALVNVPTLTVWCDGEQLGTRRVIDEWQTFHFPVDLGDRDTVEVRLEVDTLFEAELTGCSLDLSIQVHEVSLLDAESPFLRPPLQHDELPAVYQDGGCPPTSLDPGNLEAGIRVLSSPERMYAHAEIPIEVELKNQGDTVWLANPLPGGGHVALGLKLHDPSGKLLQDAFPRYYLSNNVFPGQSTTIFVSVPPLDRRGRFRLKLDLVDEYIDWFEERGSQPCHLTIDVQ